MVFQQVPVMVEFYKTLWYCGVQFLCVCSDTYFMKLSEYARRHEMTYRGAWKRFKAGKIKGAYMDDTGHVFIPTPEEARLPCAAVYARVTSQSQQEDLDQQAQRLVCYANARGYQVVHVIKEIASGVDDTRPKLTKLLGEGDWGTLVVEHKDRLTRIGFNWFNVLLGEQGRRVDVATPALDNTTDMTADLEAVLYSFTTRTHGKRGAKARARAAAAVALAGA
jgi:predicted site-specific integrase-resolvase